MRGPLNGVIVHTLYSRYWDDVCRYVRSRFGDGPPDPEDVAQSTFEKLAANIDESAIVNPKALLFSTARNVAIDMIRSQNRQYARQRAYIDVRDEEPADQNTPERVLLSKVDVERAMTALERMPETRREIFILNRHHGLSLREIARRTGMSKTTIIRQLDAAIEAIEAAVEAGDDEGGR